MFIVCAKVWWIWASMKPQVSFVNPNRIMNDLTQAIKPKGSLKKVWEDDLFLWDIAKMLQDVQSFCGILFTFTDFHTFSKRLSLSDSKWTGSETKSLLDLA